MHEETVKANNFIKIVEKLIFNIRWMLIPFYLGLVAVWLLFLKSYLFDIFEILQKTQIDSMAMVMILVESVDQVMIANLVKMIITGSYNSFVSKNHGYKNENISSGILKVKMGTSIVGISSIHLLQQFVNTTDFWQKIILHFSFIFGAYFMMKIEKLHVESEKLETEKELEEETHSTQKAH